MSANPVSSLATFRGTVLPLGLIWLALWGLRERGPAAMRGALAGTGGSVALILLAIAIVFIALCTYSGHIIHFLRRRSPPLPDAQDEALRQAAQRAALRYRGILPWLYSYIEVKFWLEPSYPVLSRAIPPGAFLVDLGAGMGLLPLLLAERSPGFRALGIEWDALKAAAGRHAARGLAGIEIRAGDIWNEPLPPCDVITLIDVLHYHAPDKQDALLARAAAALRPGGTLFIREMDGARLGRSRWTRVTERVNVGLGWNRGSAKVHARPLAELIARLEALDFTVERQRLDTRLQPGNALLSALKPGG